MLELLCVSLVFCAPLAALLMFIGIFLQGIADMIEDGRKNRKRAKAAKEQDEAKVEETLSIHWRQQ